MLAMGISAEQRDILKLMRSIVQSYKTLSVSNARGLRRLAKDYFDMEIDIAPTIAAVKSRRGDRIYAELQRLQGIIVDIEKRTGK